MLKKISEGRVESDSGFSIQIKGRECLEYVDKDYSIEFEWNYDNKKNKAYVYITNVNFLTNSDKEIIANNIKLAVELLNGNFEIIIE